MAHSASVGSAKRTVDVAGKRLGIKRFGAEYAKAGDIIVRQRGSQFYPGTNTKQGRDFTIFATADGIVSFRRMKGYKRTQKYVDVLPQTAQKAEKKVVVKKEVEAEKEVKTVKKTTAKKAITKKPTTKKKAEAK